MIEFNRLRTPAEILGVIVLMISLGVNIVDTDEGYDPYGCAKETVPDMMCYKLSRVNDNGIQRNCYYDRDNARKYKVCSTGWGELEEIGDTEYPTCDDSECPTEKDCPTCEPDEKECPPQTCDGCPTYANQCTACDSCCNYGGGSGTVCPTCPTCPAVCELDQSDDCELIIAYTNEHKYFCDGVGGEAVCVNEELTNYGFCNII